jgi:hypothetical protein
MFLTIQLDDDSPLVEVLVLTQLFDPFESRVLGRLHAGEELQDPQPWPQDELRFPSGEALPSCWLHPPRREQAEDPEVGGAVLT